MFGKYFPVTNGIRLAEDYEVAVFIAEIGLPRIMAFCENPWPHGKNKDEDEDQPECGYAAASRKKLLAHLKPVLGVVDVMLQVYAYYGKAIKASLHLLEGDGPARV